MAFSDQQTHFEYIADGNTVTFPFSCRVVYASDVSVTINGNPVNSDRYRVEGVDLPHGGNVIFYNAPAAGSHVVVFRNIVLIRETDYQTNGDFLATTVNRDFDRIWMALHSLITRWKRALTYPFLGTHYNAENRRIENLGRPVSSNDATTKGYVDREYNNVKNAIDTITNNMVQGWITLESFEKGNTLHLKNQVLLWQSDRQYYRWTGTLPKTVPPNSTPQTTGGIGGGGWVLVGDSALKSVLASSEGAELIGYGNSTIKNYLDSAIDYVLITDIVSDLDADSRSICYSQNKKIFVPRGVSVRCNLLPTDDVRKFVGYGNILTRDPWGHEHVFNIEKSINGSKFSVKNIIHQAAGRKGLSPCSVGVVGDSISDGAWGKQSWKQNPNSGAPHYNLSSTNYNHSLNGGSHSWAAHFEQSAKYIASRWSGNAFLKLFNISLNSMKLINGWAYRNFDYGFFQNSAYENKAPDCLIIAMGWNDAPTDFGQYLDAFDALIRKAWGYGCSVACVTVNQNNELRSAYEQALKATISEKYQGVEYYDLSGYLFKKSSRNITDNGLFYIKANGAFDTTHPQEFGQAAMGDAFSYEIFKDSYIPSFSPGEKLLSSTAPRWWDCVTPSNEHIQFKFVKSSDSAGLNQFGYDAVASIGAGSNVTLNVLVFCESPNTTLTVLESGATKFTNGNNNHNISVFSTTGKRFDDATRENLRCLCKKARLASGMLNKSGPLTTYVCQLEYGLNRIQIIYDGSPSEVSCPTLIFGDYTNLGVRFDNLRLAKRSSSHAPMVNHVGIGTVGCNVFDGLPYSKLPNWFADSALYVGYISVNTPLSDKTGILLNYDPVFNDAICIYRDGDILKVGTMISDIVSLEDTQLNGNERFQIYSYQSKAGTQIVINNIDNNIGVTKQYHITGGVVGIINNNSENKFFNLSAQYQKL